MSAPFNEKGPAAAQGLLPRPTQRGSSNKADSPPTVIPGPERLGEQGLGSERPAQFHPIVCESEPQFKKPRKEDLALAPERALRNAMSSLDLEATRVLIEAHGASLLNIELDGENALVAASKLGSLDLVKMIWNAMPREAEGDRERRVAAFLDAAQSDQKEICEWILTADLSLATAKDASGRNLLHRACMGGANKVVEHAMLCLDGPGLQSKDVDGNTPLILAAIFDHGEVIAHLCRRIVDGTETNKIERTAMHEAMARSNLRALSALLKHGRISDKPKAKTVAAAESSRYPSLIMDMYFNACDLKTSALTEKQRADRKLLRNPDFLLDHLVDMFRDEATVQEKQSSLKASMMRMTHDILSRQLTSHFEVLCLAMARNSQSGNVDRSAISDMQIKQVAAGLLARLPTESEEEKATRESRMHNEFKETLLHRLAIENKFLRTASETTVAILGQLPSLLSQLTTRFINFEGVLDETRLRQELTRTYGLFGPVLDLLLDAIRETLKQCDEIEVEVKTPGYCSFGQMQDIINGEQVYFSPALAKRLQLWENDLQEYTADLEHWDDEAKAWKESYYQREAPDRPCYPVPRTYPETRAAVLHFFSEEGAACHDEYLDLVSDQWATVRRILIQNAENGLQRNVQPDGATEVPMVLADELDMEELFEGEASSASIEPVEMGQGDDLDDAVKLDLDSKFFESF